jgi:hypothetical protein
VRAGEFGSVGVDVAGFVNRQPVDRVHIHVHVHVHVYVHVHVHVYVYVYVHVQDV